MLGQRRVGLHDSGHATPRMDPRAPALARRPCGGARRARDAPRRAGSSDPHVDRPELHNRQSQRGGRCGQQPTSGAVSASTIRLASQIASRNTTSSHHVPRSTSRAEITSTRIVRPRRSGRASSRSTSTPSVRSSSSPEFASPRSIDSSSRSSTRRVCRGVSCPSASRRARPPGSPKRSAIAAGTELHEVAKREHPKLFQRRTTSGSVSGRYLKVQIPAARRGTVELPARRSPWPVGSGPPTPQPARRTGSARADPRRPAQRLPGGGDHPLADRRGCPSKPSATK